MLDNSRTKAGPAAMPALGTELWAAALGGAVKWNGRMYEGAAMLGSEWLDFVNRRLKEDLKLPQRVCACRSPEEMRDTCTDFWRQAIEDYHRELVLLAKLGNGFLNNSLTAAQSHIEEAAREMRQPLAVAA